MLFYILVFTGLFLIFYGIFSHVPNSKKQDEEKGKKVLCLTAVTTFLLFLVRAIPNLFGVLLSLLPFVMEYKKQKEDQGSATKNEKEITEGEALEILGLDKNTDEEEIKTAFKNLISKNHPDKGGSKYFTNKLISARDVLLKKYGGKK